MLVQTEYLSARGTWLSMGTQESTPSVVIDFFKNQKPLPSYRLTQVERPDGETVIFRVRIGSFDAERTTCLCDTPEEAADFSAKLQELIHD